MVLGRAGRDGCSRLTQSGKGGVRVERQEGGSANTKWQRAL